MKNSNFKHIDVDKLGIELPNLDGFIDPKDLEVVRNELKAIGAALLELNSYALCKAMAMEHRIRGQINLALACEQACDSIAKRLPEWAKW